MKIMYSATYNTLSGANQSLLVLSKLQKTMGNEVVVLVPRAKENSMLDACQQAQIPTYTVGFTSEVANQKDASLSAWKKFKHGVKAILVEVEFFLLMVHIRPDVFHINTICSSSGYWAAKALRIPIAWHIREFVEEDYHFTFINKSSLMRKMHQVDAVIAISQSIKQKFSPLINNPHMETIYNGIDTNKYKISNREYQGNITRLNVVGRLIPAKGQKNAINAIQMLYQSGITNLVLRLCGGEAEQEYLKELQEASERTPGIVQFCGILSDPEEIYGDTDICLVCSRCEPFGRVSIEAMLCGCLVIGANTGGTSELITDGVTGYLYEEGNDAELAEKIRYAIAHPCEVKQIVANAKEYAKQHYTATANAKAIASVYQRISR